MRPALAANEPKPRVALIGIGSPFGDDTLGWQVLDALRKRPLLLPEYEVAFEKADRPGPGLLEYMQGFDVAVLIDALDAGLPPGTVKLLGQDDLAKIELPASTHSLGVAEALALGQTLQMLPERLYLLGVQMGAQPGEAALVAVWAELNRLLEE